MNKKAPKMTLEESIQYLEKVANELEQGDLSINNVIKTYKEARQIVNACKKEINAIETSIIEINQECL